MWTLSRHCCWAKDEFAVAACRRPNSRAGGVLVKGQHGSAVFLIGSAAIGWGKNNPMAGSTSSVIRYVSETIFAEENTVTDKKCAAVWGADGAAVKNGAACPSFWAKGQVRSAFVLCGYQTLGKITLRSSPTVLSLVSRRQRYRPACRF